MSLGDRIDFVGGSYEIRGVVDGRYVVRIRNRAKNHEAYRVWTEQDRVEFDKVQQGRADTVDRNAQIYERRLSGETLAALAQEFGLSASRIRDICAKQERKERRGQPVPA
jgi:DNA-directed RNA polymerase sigma subunit (sigma70/sigma32)